MIDVTGLCKSFGTQKAVDGVSFSIAQGETLGLLGTNGAGKTTTISMLVGVLTPDQGAVRVAGGSPTSPETRRRIGIAPQALSLYEELTAEENLTFFGGLYDMDRQRMSERLEWALQFSGLTDRRHKRVSTFSGGMKRRLNLVCALIHDPDVILLDEPTVGVDPQSRNHIFDRIEELQQRGKTIIYTTHYMEEAQRLCDRVAIMDFGRILEMDSVPGLVDRHGGDSIVEMELKALPEDPAVLPAPVTDGTRLRFSSADPVTAVLRLSQSGLDFSALKISEPGLECVFLNLTGRALRDD